MNFEGASTFSSYHFEDLSQILHLDLELSK